MEKDLLTINQGERLILLARQAIEQGLHKKILQISGDLADEFSQRRGVFVTLHKKGELRGCIGFLQPIFPLSAAVSKAAHAAAFEDPRFPQLSAQEYPMIDVEVSVLTVPKELKLSPKSKDERVRECMKAVKIGTHGLIIEKGMNSGCLLPQVAPEQGWDAEEFLNYCCLKAGIASDSWKLPGCRISCFSAQIFCEAGGNVIERKTA